MNKSTERFRDKRESILDAGARMFNQHGVKGAMISEVARSVGLATNSLTYYYRKKEDLVAACLLRSLEAMGAAADAAAQASTAEQRLRDFVDRYLGLLARIGAGEHPELIVFSDVLTVRAPHDKLVIAAYNELFRRVRRLLDAGQPLPVASASRNARAHLLLSSVSWARAWLWRYEPDDYPRVAQRLADILLSGIAAPGLEPAPAPAKLHWDQGGDAVHGPTREAYLRAATRLVNQHGYQGASVDRIAGLLQLTKGSFYHHHETKEELIAACFERTFGVMRAAQAAALAAPGSGLDRLAMACRSLLAFQMSEDGPLLRVTAWTGLPDPLRAETRRTMGRLAERFATLVIDGIADGSLRVVDPSIAAQVVNGMINAAAELERWAGDVDAASAFELYAMPVFTGLRPPVAAAAVAPRTPLHKPQPA